MSEISQMKSKWVAAAIASVAVVGVDAGLGSAAFAADMQAPAPVYAKAPLVPAAYNWSGFYAGVNAGGAWGDANVNTTETNTNGSARGPNQILFDSAASPTLTPSGLTAGGQAGYNYQLGSWVFGLEIDFDYFRTTASQAGSFPAINLNFNTSNSISSDWLLTARPRFGYALDRSLLYVTGGLAVTRASFNSSFADDFRDTEATSLSKVMTGWAVGGGWEYLVSANWSVKAEYLYADFGSLRTEGQFNRDAFIQPTTATHSVNLRTNIARVGVNYKFGGPELAK
jgi:outer membrane immunogenic protein